ncbi:3-oxoacyl-ACP reductase [Gordonia paraffinivorans]|uniref:SDR family oxidoreductase n=1 Tax=Gordonia paraffinivorans TaxID=175628 RepID=UPI001C9313B8|nr:SDR family NAD(P)-dependent oxidoreductase [Gordonia paraffinivorans]MBY4576088.1 3-oxoacyl-ACP reductase [Gordonia paraffinivorans]
MPNLSFDFSQRSVIVTGGGRGIGFELATLFADAGADTTIVDNDPSVVEVAADKIGAQAATADVTDTAQVEKVVADVIARTGRVDVLVNNAGVLRDTVLWKLTDDDWNTVLDVHAGGTFRFTRACVPHFRTQQFGRVINVVSYSGLRGNTGQANYATAKAGIVGFTKTAAKELARFRVTVNAISPNAETRMIASIPDSKRQELTAAIPLGRFGEPSEMAAAVGFLASEEAAYITGVVLPVDGGVSM